MALLEKYIQSYFGLQEDALAKMAGAFREERLVRHEFYLRQGAYCDRMSFVESGLVRMYRELEQRDVTHWISGPGFFVTDLRSFVFGEPSRWQMQALGDVQLFTIYKRDYDQLQLDVPEWSQLERRFLASCFSMLEDRMFAQLSLTAEERYARLLSTQPDLVLQVPLQYLASMLGMTPETLSRVRRKS